VHGRVQGVGFRWWTRQTACAMGLRGQVRNCSDGCVEVIALGALDRVARFALVLEQGPPASRVDSLDRFEPEHPPPGASFEIAG